MAPVYEVGERVGKRGYEILQAPNRGSMAMSYVARAPSGEKVFLKEFNDPTPLSDWYRPYIAYQEEMKRRVETTPFKGFSYRFVEFFEYAQKPPRTFYHQVFEYVPNGKSLAQALEEAADEPSRLSWRDRLTMAKVMMAGIKAMHAARIVHSDLKPDNLILIPVESSYKLRIIDLDFSLLADRMPPPWHGHDGLGYFGTPGYLSPEHTLTTGPAYASDVFTCGLILYELLGREGHPYARYKDEDADYFAAVRAYRAAPPALLGAVEAPARAEEIQRVLHRCLAPKAADRPSAKEVHVALLGFDPDKGPAPPVHSVPHVAPAPPPPVAPVKRAPVEKPAPPPAPPAPTKLPRLVLHAAGGAALSFGIRTQVNRELCKALGGDYVHVSDPCQFTVERDGSGWAVVPAAGASNQTLLNGKALTARTPLKPGDVLAVGNAESGVVKMPLTVEFRE